MLDINLIREHPELVRDSLQRRYMDAAIVDEILAVDIERRTLIGQVESLKAQRNAVSKEIGRMKNQEERQAKIDAMRLVGDEIAEQDEKVRQVEARQLQLVSTIPNIPQADVPQGHDEHDNVVERTSGPVPTRSFTLAPLGPRPKSWHP